MRRLLALQLLLAALLGGGLLLWPPAGLQRFWLDLQLRWAAPAGEARGVLVADIDDQSLAALREDFGPWPLRRDAYALVIEALRDAGARAIVLDLVLADARDGDAALARAIARPGAPVLLAVAELPGGRALSLPHQGLLASRPGLGLVSSALDADGLLRHWRLEPGAVPAMPLAVLRALGEAQRLQADADGRVTPLLPAGGVRKLPFARLAQAARAGLDNDAALRAAKDQVVFIGASSLYADLVMTPLGQQQGSTLLAASYAALRDGQGLRPLPLPAQLGLLALALLPALLALLQGGPRPRQTLWLGLGGALLLSLLALLLARRQGLWLDPSAALAVLALGLLLQALMRQWQTLRQAEQLRQQQQLAEAANQAKSEFLATISHELRTPLSAVLGLSELLAQGQLADGQRRQVQLIASAGRSLLTLIDELLDLSRIDMGRLALHPEPTQLPQLLEDALALMATRAAERQVRCDLQLGPELPAWVMVDAQRLSQVLLNLLGNAIKFAPQGRVSLHASRLADGRLQFAVSDTGIGIASSQLQRIFEPFLQAQGQDARLGGSGLGLAISRQLVRLMGGDIEVHSVPGAGSRFAFALTLPPAAAPATEAAAPAMPRGGLQILLAEDDELLAELLQAQLAPLVGCQIERANNGHLALALLKRLRFDILLVDVQLPGLDGHGVVRALRDHERRLGLPRLPALALSAHAHADDARASLAAGCDEHLSKPISQAALMDALRRWAPAQRTAAAAPVQQAEPRRSAEEIKRRAHAAVFLGRWGDSWAAARGDAAQAQALLNDLRACADALGQAGLRNAADALVATPQDEAAQQALQAEIEALLPSLRVPSPSSAPAP